MCEKKKVAACLSDSVKYNILERLCESSGSELRIIKADELGCTVGYIMGVPGFEKGSPVSGKAPELLIFSGFEGKELGEITAKLRGSGLYVPLKAVCTPANLGWTLLALADELAKEHEYMKKRAEKSEDTAKA